MNSNTKSKFAKSNDNEEETIDEVEETDKVDKLKVVQKSALSSFGISSNYSGSYKKNKLIDYSPIDSKSYFTDTAMIDGKIPIYWKGTTGPNIICLHGAGHSAMSFAPFAGVNDKYRIIAFDFNGHGNSAKSEDSADFAQESLISQTIRVLEYVNEIFPEESMIVLGHSMGGSIATKTVAEIFKNEEKYKQVYDKIQGLIVIDVVEGTAMEALPFMENIVKTRPTLFKTVQDAIEYMYKSGTIKNLTSARISVPSLVEETTNNKGETIFKWKTDLLASQKHWTDWFLGLTKCFLSIKVPKILLLAGSERMDKDLTIAQMQGKFKLHVLSNVGHIIHEDDPKSTFDMLDKFIQTFRIPANFADFKPVIGKLGSSKPSVVKYEQFDG